MIEIGRKVRFFAGYGGIDGEGAIVAVHGDPNPAPAESMGVMRIMRRGDCRVDVILFDGRRISDLPQCSIDGIGIGIKLLPELVSIDGLEELACKREADEAIRAAKARADFEAGEAARVIVDPSLFYYNGIKDKKGEKLQKCSYSSSSLRGYPAGSVSIYARDYGGFSAKVRECFAIKNNSDYQVDYFDKDSIVVIPAHPLYPAVKAAMLDADAKWDAKRARRAA